MNLLPGTRDGDEVVVGDGWRVAAPDRGNPQGAATDDGHVTVGLRPEGIEIVADGHPAEVVAVEPLGSEVIIDVRVDGASLKVRAAPDVRPEAGSTVGLRADPAAVRLFDGTTGRAIH